MGEGEGRRFDSGHTKPDCRNRVLTLKRSEVCRPSGPRSTDRRHYGTIADSIPARLPLRAGIESIGVVEHSRSIARLAPGSIRSICLRRRISGEGRFPSRPGPLGLGLTGKKRTRSLPVSFLSDNIPRDRKANGHQRAKSELHRAFSSAWPACDSVGLRPGHPSCPTPVRRAPRR